MNIFHIASVDSDCHTAFSSWSASRGAYGTSGVAILRGMLVVVAI
jgi:hypothetical protein